MNNRTVRRNFERRFSRFLGLFGIDKTEVAAAVGQSKSHVGRVLSDETAPPRRFAASDVPAALLTAAPADAAHFVDEWLLEDIGYTAVLRPDVAEDVDLDRATWDHVKAAMGLADKLKAAMHPDSEAGTRISPAEARAGLPLVLEMLDELAVVRETLARIAGGAG